MEGRFNSDGGEPYDDEMEARVARLETGVSDIKATLARLEPVFGQAAREVSQNSNELGQVKKDLLDLKTKDLVELKVGLARLEGRVSQLRTTIQMIGFIFAVLALAGFTRYLGI